jgi:PadR family transcriptional regulator, regulatory protein PadR
MGGQQTDQLQGALDLLVLRVLSTVGSLHGYTIAEQIQRLSADALRVQEGSLYPALHRMEEAGWIKSKWGLSDNSRRARYYAITSAGRRRFAQLERHWAKHVEAVARVMKMA